MSFIDAFACFLRVKGNMPPGTGKGCVTGPKKQRLASSAWLSAPRLKALNAKTLLRGFAVVSLALSALVAASTPCGDGFVKVYQPGYGKDLCFRLTDLQYTWDGAQSTCRSTYNSELAIWMNEAGERCRARQAPKSCHHFEGSPCRTDTSSPPPHTDMRSVVSALPMSGPAWTVFRTSYPEPGITNW